MILVTVSPCPRVPGHQGPSDCGERTLATQEFADGSDGPKEHQRDKAGGKDLGGAIRHGLPADDGAPTEDAAKHQGHRQRDPFGKIESLGQKKSPDHRETTKEGAGNEGSFGGGGIGEIACEAAEKEENSKRNKPAGVSHVLVDSTARRSRRLDWGAQNARRILRAAEMSEAGPVAAAWTEKFRSVSVESR